jgi:hypothetical protein
MVTLLSLFDLAYDMYAPAGIFEDNIFPIKINQTPAKQTLKYHLIIIGEYSKLCRISLKTEICGV